MKDLISTAGLRTTHGSAVHRDYVPDHDAPTVTRMRDAGAIVIGKANTPEFGLAAETFTMFGPRACNPHDLSRTTGGSSGGTAAAIAAGMSAIGLGSDAGGSIRLPARVVWRQRPQTDLRARAVRSERSPRRSSERDGRPDGADRRRPRAR